MSGFNLGTASGRISIDGSGGAEGFNVVRGAANVFFDAVERKVDRVERLGDRLVKVGVTGVAGFGLAVKAASGFEAQMSAVEAVSGATAGQMDLLRQKALQLGKDTAFSASEAGAAMEELVKAGLSVDDVLNGAADATVALAAAGEISLPEAATIASNAMNQFELSAKQMPHIADLIAGAANASAIDVGDFGFSLSQAGAVAHLTGLSFDDLSIAIAEMGNAGIKGSDAGTSLKTFLSNLIPTTDQQVSKFRELGLYTVNLSGHMKELAAKGIKPTSNSFDAILSAFQKYIEEAGGAKEGTAKNTKAALEMAQGLGVLQNSFFDATGKIKSMKDVQEILNKSTSKLTQEQKLNTLEILFGSDAIRAAAVLAKEGAKGYDEMSASINKVKAADVAATRLNNLKGSVEQLKGSFETMQIVIGNVILPIIRKLVDGITFLINIFNNLPPGVQKAIAVFAAMVTVIALLVGGAISLAFFLGPLLGRFIAFRALKAIFSIFSAGFAVWRTGAGASLALQASLARITLLYGRASRAVQTFIIWGRRFIATSRLMGKAWAFITGPWGIAILAIAAAGVILYKTWKPFRDLVNSVGAALKGYFFDAVNYAKEALNQLTTAFKTGKAEGTGFFGAMQKAGVNLREMWEGAKKAYNTLKSQLLPVFKQVGAEMKANFLDSMNRIQRQIKTELIPALKDFWAELQKNIIPAAKQLAENLKPLVVMFYKLYLGIQLVVFFALLLYAKLMLGTIIPITLKLALVITNVLVVAIEIVIRYIIYFITWVVRLATAILRGVTFAFGWIAKYAVVAWKAVSDAVVNAWNAVYAAVSTALAAVRDVIVSGWNAVYEFVASIVQAIYGVIQAVWGLFGPLIKAIINLIIAIVVLGWTVIEVTTYQIFTRIKDGLILIWNAIAAAATFVWNQISAFFTALWTSISTNITTAWNATAAFFSGLWTSISTNTVAAWNQVAAFFVGLWNSIYTNISTKLSQTKQLIVAVWNEIKGFFNTKLNEIKTIFSVSFNSIDAATGGKVRATVGTIKSTFSGIGATLGGYFETAKRAVSGKLDELMRYVTDLPGRVRRGVGDLSQTLYSAGRAIIQGLINGLTDKINDLTDKLHDITNLIAKHKGPPKRDKILLENNGKLIMEGLIRGIVGEEGALIAALRELTASLPGQFEGAYLGALGTGLTTTPTASSPPVLVPSGPTITTIINNPIAEKASNSVAKRLRDLSSAGVL